MSATADRSARIAPLLDTHEALRWLERGPGGATSLLVMRAKGAGLRCSPRPDAMGRIHAALERAGGSGARVLLWQLDGRAGPGAPIAIAGAMAASRAEAIAAVDALVEGLKGVAEREDL